MWTTLMWLLSWVFFLTGISFWTACCVVWSLRIYDYLKDWVALKKRQWAYRHGYGYFEYYNVPNGIYQVQVFGEYINVKFDVWRTMKIWRGIPKTEREYKTWKLENL